MKNWLAMGQDAVCAHVPLLKPTLFCTMDISQFRMGNKSAIRDRNDWSLPGIRRRPDYISKKISSEQIVGGLDTVTTSVRAQNN